MSDLDELDDFFDEEEVTQQFHAPAKPSEVRGILESQHAIHGAFGRIYDRLGGEDFLLEWANENRGKFISLLVSMAPGVAPTSGQTGDINIQINNNLVPTSLDG